MAAFRPALPWLFVPYAGDFIRIRSGCLFEIESCLIVGAVAWSLFAFASCDDCQKAFAQESKQFVMGVKSQFHSGVDFFHPAFERALRWFGVLSQPNYKCAPHDMERLLQCRKQGVTNGWRFHLVSMKRPLREGEAGSKEGLKPRFCDPSGAPNPR